MTGDQAIRTLSRLTRERDQGSLSSADYRYLRACVLDELVGLSSATTDNDRTRPQDRPAPPAVSDRIETRPSLLKCILELVRRVALRLLGGQ
jgi:hypothetical protein